MQKEDRISLLHMLDSAREAVSFIAHKTRASLDKDRRLVLALVKSIEIIGEAAVRVSVESQKALPSIPWQDIIGMRNRLIHAYFDINLDILWQTVIEDLPLLINKLERILLSKKK